jgi:hypothetical protein
VIACNDSNDFDWQKFALLVRVTTSGGEMGWGEEVTPAPEAAKATAVLIDEGFASLLPEAGEISIEQSRAMIGIRHFR